MAAGVHGNLGAAAAPPVAPGCSRACADVTTLLQISAVVAAPAPPPTQSNAAATSRVVVGVCNSNDNQRGLYDPPYTLSRSKLVS